MKPSPRSLPDELRMPVDALYGLSWARAGHFAVVDACDTGWDTGAEYIASQIHCSKDATLEAGRGNLGECWYTSHRLRRKKMKDGNWLTSTHFTVNRSRTTRNGRRTHDLRYVVLDTDFLERHPRQSDLKKRVYHAVCYEQWRYGGCALWPSELAELLGAEGTASKSAAERVGRIIHSLIEEGELTRKIGGLIAPKYPEAAPDHKRFRVEALRASSARIRRQSLGKTLHSEPTPLDSEPTPPPLGTEPPSTRNHTTPLNYKEHTKSSEAELREIEKQEQGQEQSALSEESEAGSGAARHLQGHDNQKTTEHIPLLPASIIERLGLIFEHASRRALAVKTTASAWKMLYDLYGDPYNQAQLAVAEPFFLALLNRVTTAKTSSGEHSAYGALSKACSYARGDDGLHANLKSGQYVPDTGPIPEGYVRVDMDAFFADPDYEPEPEPQRVVVLLQPAARIPIVLDVVAGRRRGAPRSSGC